MSCAFQLRSWGMVGSDWPERVANKDARLRSFLRFCKVSLAELAGMLDVRDALGRKGCRHV
jgi:hypothetical protein